MFDDEPLWTAVINDEEQYSIWPANKEVPAGWAPVGETGTRDHCLDYIERTWTDMRPRSLRVWMEAQQAASR